MSPGPSDPVEAVARRTAEVVESLRRLRERDLEGPSLLPGWSRLTIACHLRFGAVAFRRITEGGISGSPAAYYPGGRSTQRPLTLRPSPGEGSREVVRSLAVESDRLHELWRGMDRTDWERVAREPEGEADLGPLPLSVLPLLRLTEVEVHGTDLDLGCGDWNDTFVDLVLPWRLDQLNRRRTNHRSFDAGGGSWLLRSADGFAWHISVEEGRVVSRSWDGDHPVEATITGTRRDLLAILLGRPCLHPVSSSGDLEVATRFHAAFPGP